MVSLMGLVVVVEGFVVGLLGKRTMSVVRLPVEAKV